MTMSREVLVNQGKLVFENIKGLDQSNLLSNPGNLQPWQNMSFEDFVNSFNDMIKVLDSLYEDGVLLSCPFNIINGLNGQITNTFNQLNAFNANKAQQHFHASFQHVETLRTHIQQWGLRYEAVLGQDIEERSKIIDDELTKILSNKSEIESIKASVNSLIEPAVAGSLSKSFSDRKEALHENQKRWFNVSIATAAISIIATIIIVWSIVGVFSSTEVLDALEKGKNGVSGVVWSTIGLRIGALIPIYSIFLLSFLQYKKERDLEEEYAHKAAVATSLPNYGGLAVENDVKDQILSEASKVIFTSPSKKDSAETNGDTIGVAQLNGLLGNIHKLIPKSQVNVS